MQHKEVSIIITYGVYRIDQTLYDTFKQNLSQYNITHNDEDEYGLIHFYKDITSEIFMNLLKENQYSVCQYCDVIYREQGECRSHDRDKFDDEGDQSFTDWNDWSSYEDNWVWPCCQTQKNYRDGDIYYLEPCCVYAAHVPLEATN
eukprot:TRINITY_DN12191_c0_g1_i1.p1 TRINITY_DN12191_c0_g1~~TRINITY_DN12191_c0_g1_i1.p1  ORF type:complete len:146 (-),score=25.21 TRINITY_DN12191_c0_g1_i1:38-475(-)